ncbi:MAG: modification methylase [Ilumatobacteraceae bacterium]
MTFKAYRVERDSSLDYIGEAYATVYPNLHRYPATMIPQLGISLLERLQINGDSMLDPYCGSGSSFVAGVHTGFKKLSGYDLNPLAALISKVKFTRIDAAECRSTVTSLVSTLRKIKVQKHKALDLPTITNVDYWFSANSVNILMSVRKLIDSIEDNDIRDLFTLAFSETIRDVSYTRNNEFKLYRIPPEKLAKHNPDVKSVFESHLKRISDIYLEKYLPILTGVKMSMAGVAFSHKSRKYDVVLTSPPYGDSRTTVAYGQFSTLTNEWLGITNARKIDGLLMGGRRSKTLVSEGRLAAQVAQVAVVDEKRALEVSSYYEDLGDSIREVAKSISQGGYAIYIVGNRRVKDVQLETDQFIAEQFESAGLEHVTTYERVISSKSMPAVNSPSNKSGVTQGTMTQEFVVICKKS